MSWFACTNSFSVVVTGGLLCLLSSIFVIALAHLISFLRHLLVDVMIGANILESSHESILLVLIQLDGFEVEYILLLVIFVAQIFSISPDLLNAFIGSSKEILEWVEDLEDFMELVLLPQNLLIVNYLSVMVFHVFFVVFVFFILFLNHFPVYPCRIFVMKLSDNHFHSFLIRFSYFNFAFILFELLHWVEITDLIESIIREVPIHEDTISSAYI